MNHRLHQVARTLDKLRKCLYCYLAPTLDRGIGVFAARNFDSGMIVMEDCDGDFFSDVMPLEDLYSSGLFDYPLQVGPNSFRVPSGSIEDFTNHSCNPNTGIRQIPQGILVVAIRDICTHDEITFDYSTWMSSPVLTFECQCGTQNCRGRVGPFTSLPADLQRHYRHIDVVGKFVIEELDEA